MKIGILAVQGAFIEHIKILEKLGCECVEFRKKADICKVDGLVLPGGESTVQGKLLDELDMFDTLREMIANGLPTLATCAGLILLSEKISNDNNKYFATLPVTVKRNAYGRQLGSFQTFSNVEGIGETNMIFIRAPYIEKTSDDVSILSIVDGKIVAVKHKNQIGLSFHPELSEDTKVHEYFIKTIESNIK